MMNPAIVRILASAWLALFFTFAPIASADLDAAAQPVSQWNYAIDPATGAGQATYPGEVHVKGSALFDGSFTISGFAGAGGCVSVNSSGVLGVFAGGCAGTGTVVTYTGTPSSGIASFSGLGTITNGVTIGTGFTFSAGTLSANGLSYANFSNTLASGTAPDNIGTSYAVQALNTTTGNTIAGASLSSNQITLPAGTYTVSANVPVAVGTPTGGRCKLFNVTDSADLVVGSNFHVGSTAGSGSSAHFTGSFVLAATKTVALECIATASIAAGYAASVGGSEVYETISFVKIA